MSAEPAVDVAAILERPSAFDRLLAQCSINGWSGEPGQCHWCGGPLSGRQTVWCSAECRLFAVRNHVWSMASRAALARDRGCVRCRDEGIPITARPRQWSGYLWGGVGMRLETNHIRPLAGTGLDYSTGCQHHLDGLEVLCHWHHVQETIRQRRERLGLSDPRPSDQAELFA